MFNFSDKVYGNKFEGIEEKGVQLELGKDLFLKGFDEQLVGVKKNDVKNLKIKMKTRKQLMEIKLFLIIQLQ